MTTKQARCVQLCYLIGCDALFTALSHSQLLLKLRSYGISCNVLSWIENFLTNRSQPTKGGNSLSNITKLFRGVVQDLVSVIEPLLFVLFINDIANLFSNSKPNCVCKNYADDLKRYSILQTGGEISYLQDKCVHNYNIWIHCNYYTNRRMKTKIICVPCRFLWVHSVNTWKHVLPTIYVMLSIDCRSPL